MKLDYTLLSHVLIVGDLGTVVVLAAAVSGFGSLFSTLTAYLRKKDHSKVAITLPDGSKIDFDKAMTPQEVAQRLGDIADKVHGALDASSGSEKGT